MQFKEIIRYLSGYLIGLFLFVLIIPYGIYKLSLYLNEFSPGISENIYIRLIISAPFLVIGGIFVLWSNLDLFRVGKGGPTDGFGVAISPRTKHLVVSGPYKYTRNPMVFGAFACYLALTIIFNSIIASCVIIIFMIIVPIYLKIFEEKRLLRDFGDEYLLYKKRVSMIIPLPSKKKF